MNIYKKRFLLKKLEIKSSIDKKKSKIELYKYLKSSSYKKTLYYRLAFLIFFISILVFNNVLLIPNSEIIQNSYSYVETSTISSPIRTTTNKQFFIVETDKGIYKTTNFDLNRLEKNTPIIIERNIYLKPTHIVLPYENIKHDIPQNIQFFYIVFIFMIISFITTKVSDVETNKIVIYMTIILEIGCSIYYLFFN